jgi:L-2-hydroxycarboxylate dehydrogenase (NAD+)
MEAVGLVHGTAPNIGGEAADTWRGAARFEVDRLVSFTETVLSALGLPPVQAKVGAEALILADIRGVDSHGIARLPFYAERLQLGLVDPGAELTIVRETPATLALDANNGFGLTMATAAMERCIAKAEATGLCLTTVRRSNHFGIAGGYALMAARRGLGGLAMTNTAALVVPMFGLHAAVGTNPLAFAVPTGRGDAPPLVLDMSTSAVAWGKIEVARRSGAEIPLGWAVDETGTATTDPWAARWLTPLGGDRATGGQKGYGLGVVVDVLCGPLAGAAWSAHIDSARGLERSANLGHAFLAWRIDAFRDPEEFFADVAVMLAELRATTPAPGHEATGVLAPGDPEIATEAINRVEGVPVKPAVITELRALAARVGVPFALEEDHGSGGVS